MLSSYLFPFLFGVGADFEGVHRGLAIEKDAEHRAVTLERTQTFKKRGNDNDREVRLPADGRGGVAGMERALVRDFEMERRKFFP